MFSFYINPFLKCIDFNDFGLPAARGPLGHLLRKYKSNKNPILSNKKQYISRESQYNSNKNPILSNKNQYISRESNRIPIKSCRIQGTMAWHLNKNPIKIQYFPIKTNTFQENPMESNRIPIKNQYFPIKMQICQKQVFTEKYWFFIGMCTIIVFSTNWSKTGTQTGIPLLGGLHHSSAWQCRVVTIVSRSGSDAPTRGPTSQFFCPT